MTGGGGWTLYSVYLTSLLPLSFKHPTFTVEQRRTMKSSIWYPPYHTEICGTLKTDVVLTLRKEVIQEQLRLSQGVKSFL